jgi:hypothetical protein
MFSCEQHCNIVPQYCNFDRQIALSNLQPTRTNCKLKFTILRFVNKDSDWTIRKREAPIQLPRLFDWRSLFLIVQSEALFTNLLWISTCNLFVSVANCSEQSAYQHCNIVGQYCNIVGQYCNIARKRTSGLTVTTAGHLVFDKPWPAAGITGDSPHSQKGGESPRNIAPL